MPPNPKRTLRDAVVQVAAGCFFAYSGVTLLVLAIAGKMTRAWGRKVGDPLLVGPDVPLAWQVGAIAAIVLGLCVAYMARRKTEREVLAHLPPMGGLAQPQNRRRVLRTLQQGNPDAVLATLGTLSGVSKRQHDPYPRPREPNWRRIVPITALAGVSFVFLGTVTVIPAPLASAAIGLLSATLLGIAFMARERSYMEWISWWEAQPRGQGPPRPGLSVP
jgi:hypothetical protein